MTDWMRLVEICWHFGGTWYLHCMVDHIASDTLRPCYLHDDSDKKCFSGCSWNLMNSCLLTTCFKVDWRNNTPGTFGGTQFEHQMGYYPMQVFFLWFNYPSGHAPFYWLMLESVPNPFKLSFIDAIIKQSIDRAGQVTANPPQIQSLCFKVFPRWNFEFDIIALVCLYLDHWNWKNCYWFVTLCFCGCKDYCVFL